VIEIIQKIGQKFLANGRDSDFFGGGGGFGEFLWRELPIIGFRGHAVGALGAVWSARSLPARRSPAGTPFRSEAVSAGNGSVCARLVLWNPAPRGAADSIITTSGSPPGQIRRQGRFNGEVV